MADIIKARPNLKAGPFNYSKFERTYNTAIDLVAQAVGYARENRVPLRAIRLKPAYFYLFQTGVQAICRIKKIEFDPETELTFDGVKILMGSTIQFDAMHFDYHTPLAKA